MMGELRVPAVAVDFVVDEVAAYGSLERESGAFLLASIDDPGLITAVAVPGEKGIERERDLFTISSSSILELFDLASTRGLTIRAQIHSHRRRAFLSATDLRYGFNVDGFVTAVVPFYSAPSPEPKDWGWWGFIEEKWVDVAAPVVTEGTCSRLSFAMEQNG